MGRPGVMIYFDVRPGLKKLKPEQRCAVYEAILDYAEFGTNPTFDDAASDMFWELVKPRLDADEQAYMQKVEKRRSAANARWYANAYTDMQTMQMDANAQDALEKKEKRNTTEIEREIESICADKPPTRTKFIPPSVDEVKAYCLEKEYRIDPDYFVDFYQSNGWRVGKNPMKDWRAAVRTWHNKDKEKNNGKQGNFGEGAVSQFGTIGTRL